MPQKTDCSKFAGITGWNLAERRGAPAPRIPREGVIALQGNDPDPNLLRGFIPPREFGAR